jgi:hypothetical protein
MTGHFKPGRSGPEKHAAAAHFQVRPRKPGKNRASALLAGKNAIGLAIAPSICPSMGRSKGGARINPASTAGRPQPGGETITGQC